MALYKSFDYGDGTLYGNLAKSTYSAVPFSAVALGTDITVEVVDGVETYITRPKVRLDWARPTGDLLGFRVVRNQEAYPEHEEDGHIVVQSFLSEAAGTPAIPGQNWAIDQENVEPLVEGKYAYYTVWILRADGVVWTPAATAWCLIPKGHGVVTPDGFHIKSPTRKFVELFPKVFTSAQQSYLDEVDETSDLFHFLSGFAYSLDETLTYADLLTPEPRGAHINPNVVDLLLHQLGLPKEATLGLRRKKALIRNAFEIHHTKGTLAGLNLFARSLTGFNLNTTEGRNVLLNAQDSSFYTSTGNWQADMSGVLTATTEETPYQGEMLAVDREWTGKLVAANAGTSLTLGAVSNKTSLIPVTNLRIATLSFYVKGATSALDFGIVWYDVNGAVIQTDAGVTSSVTSSWAQQSVQLTAPAGAVWATIYITFASAGTYFVDMVTLQTPSATEFEGYREARSIELTIAPTKVNYLENPSFQETMDVEDTDWTWSGVTVGGVNYGVASTAPGIFDGSHMLELTTDPTAPFSLSTHSESRLPTGRFYTFSVFVSTVSGTQDLSFSASVFGSDGEALLDGNGNTYTNTTTGTATTDWQRFTVSVRVPFTADTPYLMVEVSTNGELSSGNVLCFDAAQVEQGYSATDYFDGSYSELGAYWTADVDDSVSVLFRNKKVKMDRLVQEINPYLPMNTAWTVISGIPGAYTLEASGFSS